MSLVDEDLLKTMSPAAGKVLAGRYEVIRELGRGGMGEVLLVRDKVSKVQFALKYVPDDIARNSVESEDLTHSFALVCKLNHESIANYKSLDRDPETGRMFLLMEFVDGLSLDRWLKKKGPLSEKAALRLLSELSSAIDYAHSGRVVHRDIKPSNIIIQTSGPAKLIDFGLAAQVQSSLTRVSLVDPKQQFQGTRPYMAPELWRGKRGCEAADQWALAATVYEALAGDPPWISDDVQILGQCIQRDAPDVIDKISEPFWLAIVRALAKDPKQRWANCAEFHAAAAGGKVKGATSETVVSTNTVKRATATAARSTTKTETKSAASTVKASKPDAKPAASTAKPVATQAARTLDSASTTGSVKRPLPPSAAPQAKPATPASMPTSPSPSASSGVRPSVAEVTAGSLSPVTNAFGVTAWDSQTPQPAGSSQTTHEKPSAPDSPARTPEKKANETAAKRVAMRCEQVKLEEMSEGPLEAGPQEACYYEEVVKPLGIEFLNPSDFRYVREVLTFKQERFSLFDRKDEQVFENFEFVVVQPDSFVMGSPGNEGDRRFDERRRKTTISKAFMMMTTPLTNEAWGGVMGEIPSEIPEPDYPVTNVNWFQVQEFIEKLNRGLELDLYRLPTEAEWEFACRAGAVGPVYGPYDEIAWYDGTSGGRPHPVARKKPNQNGLYDMLGNVFEWCQDWYGEYATTIIPGRFVVDPRGPKSGDGRVCRGGSFNSNVGEIRCAARNKLNPVSSNGHVGFRLVRTCD